MTNKLKLSAVAGPLSFQLINLSWSSRCQMLQHILYLPNYRRYICGAPLTNV